jgi:HD-like signal output (HDOD) protein
MELASLVDQPNKLPTIPKVLQKLIESFSDEDVSVNEIARQLAADPALSAKLLRLANSAYFHVSRTVATVDDAVRMLGFVMVRNLVLGNGMVAAFPRIPGIDLQQFWRYNLYTASASRWLAIAADENGDTAFTLGIMHSIGQLQMHMGMPDAVAPLDKKTHILDAGRAELEKAAFGFHYGEVSAALAKIWNFPTFLTDALHDIPTPLVGEPFSISAGLVHLGAWRSRTEIMGMDDGAIAASYPVDVGNKVGLDRGWTPSKPWVTTSVPPKHVMPPLKVLTEGLDAMLD